MIGGPDGAKFGKLQKLRAILIRMRMLSVRCTTKSCAPKKLSTANQVLKRDPPRTSI